MHSHFTAVFDACVLYPATLRNFLLQLATTGLFRARWTNQIHDEWMRSLAARRPDIGLEPLERIRFQIDRAVPDCLVTGFEPLVESLELPDPNDRHVLAAAIVCGANVIVTMNERDFPEDLLAPHGIAAQDPDRFVLHQFDLDPGAVCTSAKTMRRRLQRPAYDPFEFLDLLQARGLPGTASRLREFIQLI
ncbi:MAG: PIN domain-containing protein [Planctomycetes bacterium]|nr:PIN domain-containing protein [Planctomycetota bacterium]